MRNPLKCVNKQKNWNQLFSRLIGCLPLLKGQVNSWGFQQKIEASAGKCKVTLRKGLVS